ncbi:MAG TPA: L-seryl-tRNA(Sec) selenium transferase [Terriglobales bacterium]|nr:L-seryl-tRNA(Sec) selenium transferase [Terriglobales bacterium]
MPRKTDTALFRNLPSVDEVLRLPAVLELVRQDGNAMVADAARTVVSSLRAEIAAGQLDERGVQLAVDNIGDAISRQLRVVLEFSLRPVINATGVILHTNLGRSPLSPAVIGHIREASTAYSNLEFDLETGDRGKRDVHVQRLFAKLFAPDADYDVQTIVVNNCAAAVMLALNSLAEGGEVIVSRGELVEIGGSFRVPEVMAKSQAKLREVGTTNRTRIADYENAINEKTKLLLRVHRSNFEIVGFTEQPSLAELAALGKKHNLPVMEDQGNGSLFDLRSVGVTNESGVAESLRAGIGVVTYSGDKLLGGPQAGMLTGRPEFIRQIRANPMFRALRIDKLTYAALEATLLLYLRGEHDAIPILRMIRASAEDIGKRAQALLAELRKSSRSQAVVVPGQSVIGGGTTPGGSLPTFLIGLSCAGHSADDCQAKLRQNHPPIIARVENGQVWLDLRTVFPEQEAALLAAIQNISQ